MIDQDELYISPNTLNKLFCTFTPKDDLTDTIERIKARYTIMYSKIFILDGTEKEYIATYNVDTNNLADNALLPSTILTHRRKASKTLYTINALNLLVASLNGGKIDHNFPVPWEKYSNCILLTREGEFTKIDTVIHQIINLDSSPK